MYESALLCATPSTEPERLASSARALLDLGVSEIALAHAPDLDGHARFDLRISAATPQSLSAQADALRHVGFEVSPVLARSADSRGLRAVARAHGAEAIVVAVGEEAVGGFVPRKGIAAVSRELALPMLILGVHPPRPVTQRLSLLSHVLLPADLGVRAGCVAACLERVARTGAERVTLAHMSDLRLQGERTNGCPGAFGRLDLDWVEHLKSRLLSAGVNEVRLEVAESADLDTLLADEVPVTLVLLSGHCNELVLEAYRHAVESVPSHGVTPAFMLPAGACDLARSRVA